MRNDFPVGNSRVTAQRYDLLLSGRHYRPISARSGRITRSGFAVSPDHIVRSVRAQFKLFLNRSEPRGSRLSQIFVRERLMTILQVNKRSNEKKNGSNEPKRDYSQR
jgi:hypothetical protein